jgi:hypothetical protein
VPAASLAELRDFESQFASALSAILAPFEAAPYSVQLVSHDFTGDLTTPRLEFDLTVGEPAGPGGTVLTHPTRKCQLAWSGTLSFRHVYDPLKVTAANAGAFRGALRTLFDPSQDQFTLVRLPWLKIDSLNETNSVRGRFKDDGGQQLADWISTWDIIWTIRADAFPA